MLFIFLACIRLRASIEHDDGDRAKRMSRLLASRAIIPFKKSRVRLYSPYMTPEVSRVLTQVRRKTRRNGGREAYLPLSCDCAVELRSLFRFFVAGKRDAAVSTIAFRFTRYLAGYICLKSIRVYGIAEVPSARFPRENVVEHAMVMVYSRSIDISSLDISRDSCLVDAVMTDKMIERASERLPGN